MSQEKEKKLIATVSTNIDLREKTSYIVELIENVINKFTTNEILPISFSLYYVNGKVSLLRFNKTNWSKTKEKLNTGMLEAIVVNFLSKDKDAKDNIYYDLQVQVILCGKQIKDQEYNGIIKSTNEVSLCIPPRILGCNINFLKKWFCEIYLKIDGINAYFDYLPETRLAGVTNPTMFEITTNPNALSLGRFNEKLRGYFWANILNDKQIEFLGGEKYVLENMPYIHKEILFKSSGEKFYYFELTDNIFIYDYHKYLQLKEFVKPLLDPENLKMSVLHCTHDQFFNDYRLAYDDEQKKKIEELKKIPKLELDKILFAEESLKKQSLNVYQNRSFKLIKKDVDPTYLNFKIIFTDIKKDGLDSFEKLLNSWIEVGLLGGYKGLIHSLKYMKKDDNGISFGLDMGSVDLRIAGESIEAIINQYAKTNNLIIKEMIIE